VRFGRRSRVSQEIPNSSLSDIAFLLLIFFMVSTVFAIEEGLLLQLPSKEGVVKKIARKNIMRISAYPDGQVTIDDEPTAIEQIRSRVEQATVDNPKIVIVVETHPNARYGLMIDVLDELKLAQATRISLKLLLE
jgi:biopolymer transport protein ExbD